MAKFTERSLADNQTWSIKQSINQSGLDFVLSESPYSISVKILKRFLKDRSQEISPPQTLESNPATFPLSPPTNHNESKFEGMEQDINRLKNIIDKKDDEIKAITETKAKDLKTLQTSSDQKTLQIQTLKSEINKNHETNSYSQKQLKILTDNLAVSQKGLQTTKENLTNTQKLFQTTQEKLKNSLDQLQTTKNELSLSQKQLQTTKEQLTNLPKQLQSTKDKFDKSQKELQSTKDKLTDSQKQLQTTKDKSDALADSLKQLQSTKDKLIDYQKQLHTSKESLKESHKQIQNLNKETKKNSENLIKYKSQLQQKSDALLQCETELKITKDNLLDSQNQLKTLKIHSDNVESKNLENDQKLKLMKKEKDKNASTPQIQPQKTKDTLSISQIQSQTTKDNPPDHIPQLTLDIYPTYSDKDRSPTSSHLHTKNFKNHVLRITKIGIFSWKHHGEGWESMVNTKNGQLIKAKTFELSCILCDFVLPGNRTDRTGPLENWQWSYRKDGVKNPTYCATYF